MIPHDHASERRGQSGDQQSMIPPGDRAGDGAGGVAAQAVGDEPFAVEQDLARTFGRDPKASSRTTVAI